MEKITLTRREIERLVELALEGACAWHATGNYKLMMYSYGEATGWLDFLDDNGIDCTTDLADGSWITINEHVTEMLELLHEELSKLQVVPKQ